MGTVHRLPVRDIPGKSSIEHCPRCNYDISDDVSIFSDLYISTPEPVRNRLSIMGLTVHLRCVCGQEFDLNKTAKRVSE